MVADQTSVGSARERILEAAERVTTEVGAARMTLDGVAHAAGVSKGGLLYHFPSKESLLGALAQRYVDSFDECIGAARGELQEGSSRDLKACILGVLGSDPRSKGMGAVLLATACGSSNPLGGGSASGDLKSVVVGSADFPESKIIAEIYAQALEAN